MKFKPIEFNRVCGHYKKVYKNLLHSSDISDNKKLEDIINLISTVLEDNRPNINEDIDAYCNRIIELIDSNIQKLSTGESKSVKCIFNGEKWVWVTVQD